MANNTFKKYFAVEQYAEGGMHKEWFYNKNSAMQFYKEIKPIHDYVSLQQYSHNGAFLKTITCS